MVTKDNVVNNYLRRQEDEGDAGSDGHVPITTVWRKVRSHINGIQEMTNESLYKWMVVQYLFGGVLFTLWASLHTVIEDMEKFVM